MMDILGHDDGSQFREEEIEVEGLIMCSASPGHLMTEQD